MFEMNQDIFDSRDLIERLEELEALKDSVNEGEASPEEIEEWAESEDEYNTLRNFADEGEVNCEDWEYGETFIHEDYFTEYTKDMLADCGFIPADLPDWIEIDWEETAANVQEDYTEYTLDGNTYYAR